jgi:hypothetical protein
VVSGVFGAGKEGYEGGSAPSETAPWAALSECESSPAFGAPAVSTTLAYSWTVTTDVDVLFANGHVHVGGISMRVYAEGGSFGSRTLICESVPTYAPAGDAQAGFIVNMSVCDWRDTPLRLSKGTKLTAVSEYWADSEAPFPMPAPGGGVAAPHWAQMPWTGAMGYLFLDFSLAPGAPFSFFTVNGQQADVPLACSKKKFKRCPGII